MATRVAILLLVLVAQLAACQEEQQQQSRLRTIVAVDPPRRGCAVVRCGGNTPRCVETNGRARCVVVGETKLNPCLYAKCTATTVCKVVNKQAKCVPNGRTVQPPPPQKECPKVCPLYVAPVCGSDGKTYSNQCFLSIETCKSNGAVKLKQEGACKDVKKNNDPNRCPQIQCPAGGKPVCANNGKTYKNACYVKSASCNIPQLHVAYEGECHAPCMA